MQLLNLKRNGKSLASDEVFRNASKWNEILLGYGAIVDAPGNEFAMGLAHAYPNAKVILTIRDSPEAWLESWRRTVYYQQVMWSNSWSMRIMATIDDLVGLAKTPKADKIRTALGGGKLAHGESELLWYERTNEAARKYIPADRLLEFNVKQGWEPLCRFLGKEIPNVPFPHTKDAAQYKVTVDERIREQQQRLQWLATGTILLLGAPTALLVGPLARLLGTAFHLG